MIPARLLVVASLALASSCAPPAAEKQAGNSEQAGPPAASDTGLPAPMARADPSQPVWQMNEGVLDLVRPDGRVLLSVACMPGPARLVVGAPGFTPIGSEDRFAFGLGKEPVTLVANPRRQAAEAGVAAEGPVPANLATLFAEAGEISALYGTQQVGPVAPPPLGLVATFTDICEAMAQARNAPS